MLAFRKTNGKREILTQIYTLFLALTVELQVKKRFQVQSYVEYDACNQSQLMREGEHS